MADLFGCHWIDGFCRPEGHHQTKAQQRLPGTGITPTHEYKYGLAEIAVDASTRQLALTYGGDVSILNGSDVVKCKAGKTTSTSRPDVFDKDKKVRETVYHLDIWTRDLDRPKFRIEFLHATQMEQWRARISALAED
jgi:hypothetical protein